jgi:hypothetical protein
MDTSNMATDDEIIWDDEAPAGAAPTQQGGGDEIQWDTGETPATKDMPSWGDWARQKTGAALIGARETLPFAKDIAAGSKALTGGKSFAEAKEDVERQQKAASEESPLAYGAGEIGAFFVPIAGQEGSLANLATKAEGALASRFAPKIGQTAADIGATALTGAGLGAVQGAGEGTGLKERAESAALTSALGGVGGAALPAAGKAIGAGASKIFNVGSKLTPAEEAAARQSVDLPRYLGTEGEFLPLTAEHVGALPIVGMPIKRAGAKALEQTGEAFERIPGLKTDVGREEAGETAKQALHNWISDRSAKVANKAYDAVERHVDPKIKTELTSTRSVVQDLMTKLKEADLPEESGAVKMVLNAATNPEGLNFSGIKTLRTKVREQIAQGLLPGNLSQGELKQIKTALDADLRAAATNAGGQRGAAAFERANTLYQNISGKRKELAKIIGAKGDASPTSVFNKITQMANDKTGNPARLLTARKSMSPDQWGDITSGVVNNMGRDAEGAFSPYRFLTEYGNMTDKGRDAIFGPTGNPVRNAVEDIRILSGQFKKAGKNKNWSGTAQTAIGAAGVLEAVHDPLDTAVYGAPVLPLSLLLASPKGATLLSRYAKSAAKKLPGTKDAFNAMMSYARAEMGPTAQEVTPAIAAEDREERASGGSVGKRDYPAKRLNKLERAAKKAQDEIALETKPIMNQPDALVAKALEMTRNS